jgi:hypothetical protein
MTIKEFFKGDEITDTHLLTLKCLVIFQVIIGILLIALEIMY